MNILLALDGSPQSDAASRFIQNLEFPKGSSLYLLKVVDHKRILDASPQKPKKDKKAPINSAQSSEKNKAWQLMTQLSQSLDNPKHKFIPLVSIGSPGGEILSAIDQHKIDLVVLGTHGRKGLNRFLLGSVSEWVLAEAPCSTLIVRSKHRPTKSKSKGMRILLASDGSLDAKAAVNLINVLDFPGSSRLTILHVVKKHFYQTEQLVTTTKKTPSDFAKSAEDLLKKRGREGAQLLEKTCAMVKDTRLTVNEHLAFGYEADEILKCAKRTRADLILLGSRGLSGLRKLLQGSVSHKIARHAPCSVLVVRR